MISIMMVSSIAGAVMIGVSSLSAPVNTGYVVAPLEFQLNGTSPYVIGVALHQGQSVKGYLNATGQGTLSFVRGGTLLQTERLRPNGSYEFRSASSANYQLVFNSYDRVLVWFDMKSD